MQLRLEIDGTRVEIDAHPMEPLLDVLRRAGFWSVKHGCESGDCGACVVLLEGEPRLACLLPAAKVQDQRIATVETLGNPDDLQPLQRAFLEGGAVQCGFCTPAMLLASHALLARDPHPSDEAIRSTLAGILCRCTGYVKPVEAVRRAAAGAAGRAVSPSRPEGS